jgi:hypothetical protein
VALDTALGVTGLAGSIGVGLILLGAGFGKLRHRALLPGVIANYRLLPAALVMPTAIVLPLVEIAVGALLLGGIRPLPVLLGAGLLGLFALAMAINLLRGRAHISCGCGRKELSQSLSWPLVARNIALAAMLLPRLMEPAALSTFDIATAIGAGASLWLIYGLQTIIGATAASSPAFASRR